MILQAKINLLLKSRLKKLESIEKSIEEIKLEQRKLIEEVEDNKNTFVGKIDDVEKKIDDLNNQTKDIKKLCTTLEETQNKLDAMLMRSLLQTVLITIIIGSLVCLVVYWSKVEIDNSYYWWGILIEELLCLFVSILVIFKIFVNLNALIFSKNVNNILLNKTSVYYKIQNSKIINKIMNSVLLSVISLYLILVLVTFCFIKDFNNSSFIFIVAGIIQPVFVMIISDTTDSIMKENRTWIYNYFALSVAIVSLLLTA
ncbi:hypothetical protein [[Clostridium] fimetarium]|uniref:Uncharacterized protein n=1 Tax=[Clostridium] fimetarium TaxID=99656 RepID=A0A1I0MXG2_9FIRM|nr:hypothetical protein [[Clostridium] fimetarium]SEV93456.1 hypothetical protein SAMN05421659_102228 [[Clostridium] fimetarium]